MPKTRFQSVVFTVIMACFMVYGMSVYNVSLSAGGVSALSFTAALQKLPLMVPIVFILESLIVGRVAKKLVFTFMRPDDRPQLIGCATSIVIVCIMCPLMSLVSMLLFREPSFGLWLQTFALNLPMAMLWQMCYCGPASRLIFRTLFRRQLAARSEQGNLSGHA